MDVDGCPIPSDRWYDPETDVWLKVDPDGTSALLGLTAPLAAFAGRFLSVGFRPPAGIEARGRSVATVESTRYTGAVRLPVSARVVAENPQVVAEPRLLNNSPYDQGWVVRVRLSDPEEPARVLHDGEAARRAYQPRIRELKIRCYPAIPDSELYEIGVECSAILAQLDDEIARRAPEEVVLLVTDDATAPIEMVRWSDRTGHTVLHHRVEGNLHHFLVRRERAPTPRRRPTPG